MELAVLVLSFILWRNVLYRVLVLCGLPILTTLHRTVYMMQRASPEMQNRSVDKRGDKLREHILWVAKDVFLELGFEIASMAVIAAGAATWKRTLYAHFESKEKLFLAVIELVRSLFLSRLGVPGDYSSKASEALVIFCGRYLEILVYQSNVQMMRVSMAESERFPDQAKLYFNVMFTEVHARLSTYLREQFLISTRSASDAAHRLLSQILYPQLTRSLFGVDLLAKSFNHEALSPAFDLRAVRKAVSDLLEYIPVKAASKATASARTALD